MNKILILATALIAGNAVAQPSYFSGQNVRDDLARRTGAYEISCRDGGLTFEQSLYTYCMLIDGSGRYVKSVLDIYYDDFMSGGWKISSNDAIYNIFTKEGKTLLITIAERSSSTFVSVYDYSLKKFAEELDAKERAARLQAAKAGPAGATPGAAYITLGEFKAHFPVALQTKPYQMQLAGVTLSFTPGSRSAKANGKPATLNATPFLMDGTMHFPIAALRALGCAVLPPDDGLAGVSCGNRYAYLTALQFATKNAPASALVLPTNLTAAPQLTSESVPRPPAPTVQGVPGVKYVSIDSLGQLGAVSNRDAGALELMSGGRKITYQDGVKRTPEGFALSAAPYFVDGSLVAPVDSLKLIGCAVDIDEMLYRVACPNGVTINGVLISP